MSVVREIVTIQAGNYSNFVGTHWWNLQESSFCYVPNSSTPLDINHDVLFREGENFRKEVTYTPRLIVIDLKDNLRSIKRESELYSNPEDRNETLWEGPVEVVNKEPARLNPFLEKPMRINTSSHNSIANQPSGNCAQNSTNPSPDVEFDVNIWSDFLKTNYHPRSFCLLDNITSNEEEDPLELYSSGEESFLNGKEMIEDPLRKMIEECDYLQGFQLIFDAYNGFSGITNCMLQHFEDEYHGKSTLCFPVFQNQKTTEQVQKVQMHRLYAILISLSNLKDHCSLFSPLCLTDDVISLDGPYRKFPYIQYDEGSMYETSALLAASIETLTSQYRLKSMRFQLSDVTSSMSLYGRKLVSSTVSLPFPMSEDLYLSSMIDNERPEYFMTSQTPFSNPALERTLIQSAVLRGIPKTKFHSSKSPYQGLGPEELFGQYLNKYSSSSVTTATVFDEKCSLAVPFPNFFKSTIGTNGYLSGMSRPENKRVSKVHVAACFSNTDSAAEFIESLLIPANNRNFKDYVKTRELAVENDDYQEVIQNLMGLQENYKNY